MLTPKMLKDNWQNYVKVANKYNDPGKFTTLIAFEWTSIPNGRNMHRNVFFRNDSGPRAPYSSFDSIYPEDLWTYLEVQRNAWERVLCHSAQRKRLRRLDVRTEQVPRRTDGRALCATPAGK